MAHSRLAREERRFRFFPPRGLVRPDDRNVSDDSLSSLCLCFLFHADTFRRSVDKQSLLRGDHANPRRRVGGPNVAPPRRDIGATRGFARERRVASASARLDVRGGNGRSRRWYNDNKLRAGGHQPPDHQHDEKIFRRRSGGRRQGGVLPSQRQRRGGVRSDGRYFHVGGHQHQHRHEILGRRSGGRRQGGVRPLQRRRRGGVRSDGLAGK